MTIQKFIKGERDKAIKQLGKFVKKNPSNFIAIYNLGYFYQQIKNFEKAKEHYLKTINLNSEHWESKINLVKN